MDEDDIKAGVNAVGPANVINIGSQMQQARQSATTQAYTQQGKLAEEIAKAQANIQTYKQLNKEAPIKQEDIERNLTNNPTVDAMYLSGVNAALESGLKAQTEATAEKLKEAQIKKTEEDIERSIYERRRQEQLDKAASPLKQGESRTVFEDDKGNKIVEVVGSEGESKFLKFTGKTGEIKTGKMTPLDTQRTLNVLATVDEKTKRVFADYLVELKKARVKNNQLAGMRVFADDQVPLFDMLIRSNPSLLPDDIPADVKEYYGVDEEVIIIEEE